MPIFKNAFSGCLLQVHLLQQDCNSLRQDIQIARERLQKEKERTVQLEQECVQLKAHLGMVAATGLVSDLRLVHTCIFMT